MTDDENEIKNQARVIALFAEAVHLYEFALQCDDEIDHIFAITLARAHVSEAHALIVSMYKQTPMEERS